MSEFDKTRNSQIVNNAKRSVVKRIVILGAILAVTMSLTIWLVPVEYLIYFQSLQVSIAGYLVIEIVANTALSTGDYGPAFWSDSQLIEEPHKDSWRYRGCCHCVVIS